MKLLFAYSSLMLLAILVLPGFLLGRALKLNRIAAICSGPALTVTAFSLLAILYAVIGVRSSAFSVLLPLFAVSAVLYLIRKLFDKGTSTAKEQGAHCLILFVAVASLIALTIFYTGLDGADSYFQGWDNLHHMSAIRTFAASGNWSPFADSYYSASEVSPLTASGGFYPSAWHMLGALVVSATGAPVTIAANVTNYVLVGLIYPLGMFYLLKTLGGVGTWTESAFSAILCLGVPAATWGLLTFGPLYPNLMGTALLPGAVALFSDITSDVDEGEFHIHVPSLAAFILALPGIALSHPNTVFSLGVILAPRLIRALAVYSAHRGASKKVSNFLVPCLGAALVLVIWTVAYNIPYIHSIAVVSWPAISTPFGALLHALLLGVANHPEQLFVSILVFGGIASAARQGEHRWLIASYILVILIYVADAGSDGFLKHFLAGFWYTDYNRTGSLVGIVATVFGCLCISDISRLVEIKSQATYKTASRAAVSALCCLMFCATIYVPNLPFGHGRTIDSAFGYEVTELANQNDKTLIYYDVLSPIEEDFCKDDVLSICGDSLVLNNPQDGSTWGYAAYGINMYYRSCWTPGESSESEDSKVIRHHLNEFATNPEVRSAVESVGAKYVLQLDSGADTVEYSIFYNSNNFDEWDGINKITEETPGFELVASTDDIRLYKIVL